MTKGYFFLKPLLRTELITIGPGELPIAPTDEVIKSFWVHEFQIVNTSSELVNVSVTDRQDPPVFLIPTINSISPGQMVSGEFTLGRRMIAGIRWWASGPGVHGFIIGHEEYI